MSFEEIAQAKVAVVLVIFAAFFLAERAWPSRPPPGAPRLFRNLILWAINAGLSPFLVLPIPLYAASLALVERPEWWAGTAAIALDLVILDLWTWFWHRANHQVALLWRFHRIHHLDGHLDTTTALRFHFGEVLISAVARIPLIVVLGMPMTTVIAFEGVLLAATLFHHSNLRMGRTAERWLARIIVTPGIHWVHHHATQADTDSNFATVLSLWDRLFGTRSPNPRTPDMTLGVVNAADLPIGGLILAPFRRTPRRNSET